MAATVVVIAQGEMGAGVGGRLVEEGAQVRTSLAGRSAASAARAAKAGIVAFDSDDALVEGADFILSIVPPGDACALAERLAGPIGRSTRKPIYVDCNAVSPKRAEEVGAILAPTGAAFVDGAIIGGPPLPGTSGPRIYLSGPDAAEVMALRAHGLDLRLLEGDIGVASAFKLAYATITKGTVAIGATMILAAMKSGVAPALREEIAFSQPVLGPLFAREVPRMYHKAYRWVAEMEEIADFIGLDAHGRQIFLGAARLYEQIAEDADTRALLDAFLAKP